MPAESPISGIASVIWQYALFCARVTWMERGSATVALLAYTLPAAATIAVWQALFAAGAAPAGYTLAGLVTYSFAVRIVSAVTEPSIRWRVRRETLDQTFTWRLLRPWGPLPAFWGADLGGMLGQAAVGVLGTLVLLAACGAVGVVHLSRGVPASLVVRLALAAGDVPLAWLVLEAGFSIAAAQNLVWTDAEDLFWLAQTVPEVLAGVYVPIDLFPEAQTSAHRFAAALKPLSPKDHPHTGRLCIPHAVCRITIPPAVRHRRDWHHI